MVEALDRRLDVDPAGVDVDAVPPRWTVERICADLGLSPDWSRREAGDWTMGEPVLSVRPRVPSPNENKFVAITAQT